MSDISTLTITSSVSPTLRPCSRSMVGDAAGEQPAQGLTLLLPVDDRLVQHP